MHILKQKKTKLEKYGNENYTNRDKSKITCIHEYGVDNVSKVKEIKKKKKETYLKIWGVENIFQNIEIKEEIKKIKLEKYNDEFYTNRDKCWNTCKINLDVKYPMQSEKIKNKRNKNNFKKFGKEHYTQTTEYVDKCKITCLNKYNVEYYMQSIDFKEKSKKTYLKKYGVDHPMKLEEIQKKTKNTKIKNGSYLTDEQRTDYKNYWLKVKVATNKNKKYLFENWDGIDYYDGEYIAENFIFPSGSKEYPTIDHKTSVNYGYKNNITPKEIGKIENLCITKRSINSKKHKKTESEFIKL